MLKKIVRILLCSLAITSAVTGVIIITVRSRALDPQTYKLALAPSNLYREIRLQLEDLLLEKAAGEKPDKNNALVAAILAEIKMPDIVVSAATKNIDNFFDWANKRNVDIVLYFPRSELKSALANPSIQPNIFAKLDVIIPLLPECLTDTERDKDFSICKTNDLNADKTRLQAKLSVFFTKLAVADDFLDQILADMGIPELGQETTVTNILVKKDTDSRKQIESSLRTVEDAIAISTFLGIIFVIFSLILAMVNSVTDTLQWRKVLLNISMIYLIAGVIITAISLAATFMPEVFFPLLPGAGASLFTSSFADATNNFYHLLFGILFRITLLAGVTVTVISILLLVIGKLLPQTEAERNKNETIGADLPVDNTLAPGLKLATPPASGSIISTQ